MAPLTDEYVIDFRDFTPTQLAQCGLLAARDDKLDPLEELFAQAYQWIHDQGLEVVNLETLRIPRSFFTKGGKRPPAKVGDAQLNRLVRVWYRVANRERQLAAG